MDNLIEDYKTLIINMNSMYLLHSFMVFISQLNLLGDGDTPSPQADSPKQGSEVDGSPEINYQKPEMQEEMEEEQEMGEIDRDPTRSEGIIEYRIKDISKVSGKLLSAPIYIRDLPW